MIISTVGHGNTGASAVLDFLREYDEIDIVDDFEFQIIQMPDGILDLKYQLTQNCQRISTNAAIKRFKRALNSSICANKIKGRIGSQFDDLITLYINELQILTWKGRSFIDPDDVSSYNNNKFLKYLQENIGKIQRKLRLPGNIPHLRDRYFSFLTEEEFNAATRNFFHNLLNALNMNTDRMVVLDMLFSATKPQKGMEFFDECKVIRVNRDPRDIFAYSKKHFFINSFAPVDTSKNYAEYYYKLRKFSESGINILDIQYEDLIYRYYETTDVIMRFLGLGKRPENEFKYFNPDISVKYTQIYHDECTQNEIDEISGKLSEYLYDFKRYKPINQQRK